jgi:hypothetical protein
MFTSRRNKQEQKMQTQGKFFVINAKTAYGQRTLCNTLDAAIEHAADIVKNKSSGQSMLVVQALAEVSPAVNVTPVNGCRYTVPHTCSPSCGAVPKGSYRAPDGWFVPVENRGEQFVSDDVLKALRGC